VNYAEKCNRSWLFEKQRRHCLVGGQYFEQGKECAMADSSKKMGLMGLTTLVTVNMMGSGIIMLPINMAQLGAVSLLSWVFTAIGSMAIAYCLAQCGVFCSRSGGLSAYTEEAHAKSGFFLCSYLYFLSLAIANVAVAISAVGYMSAFLPWLSSGAIPLFVGTVGRTRTCSSSCSARSTPTMRPWSA
jgi:amino acid transporter